jgi:SAM-dependent methyltransferase
MPTGEVQGHEWFREAFGELYPLLYPHRDDESAAREVARLVELLGLEGSRARVLDLACGNGRHAVAFAAAGLRVFGFDLSPQLLQRAGSRRELTGRLVRADMRAVPFAAAFDLVVNLFTSFGYFSDEQNALALAEMAGALIPGGRLVIDHINRATVERKLVPEDHRYGPGLRITQKRQIAGNRVQKEIIVVWDDGRAKRLIEDVRLYTPEELSRLMVDSGFTDTRIYGSYGGEPFGSQSPRMVVIAKKPA